MDRVFTNVFFPLLVTQTPLVISSMDIATTGTYNKKLLLGCFSSPPIEFLLGLRHSDNVTSVEYFIGKNSLGSCYILFIGKLSGHNNSHTVFLSIFFRNLTPNLLGVKLVSSCTVISLSLKKITNTKRPRNPRKTRTSLEKCLIGGLENSFS